MVNQGQLFVWKDGKRLQTQVRNKNISAGPVLEIECINDRAIQVRVAMYSCSRCPMHPASWSIFQCL